jgi:hypothetical protein
MHDLPSLHALSKRTFLTLLNSLPLQMIRSLRRVFDRFGSFVVGRLTTARQTRPVFLFLFFMLVAFATNTTAQAQSGEWVWIGGSNTYLQPGVYGTLGTPAAGNIPGARDSSAYWTDSSGNFWMFGGEGVATTAGTYALLNDLWEFNPGTRLWTWIGGSQGFYQAGVYGTLGTPAAGNFPGARAQAATWTDKSGNLWLFGGFGIDSITNEEGNLNDLWEFNPSTKLWTWMGGSSTVGNTVGCSAFGCGRSGVYGTLGTPAPGNTPGGRIWALASVETNGNFWLYAGSGLDASGTFGNLNDVWEFTPSTRQWTWMGGSSVEGQSPAFGTQGVPAPGNIPGSVYNSRTWTATNGDFWVLGGGADGLWHYYVSSNEWAWIEGNSNYLAAGVYGTLGTSAPANNPSARAQPAGWTDLSGDFWLFGGEGFDASGNSGNLNDLWVYSPSTNEWTWMGGNNTRGNCDTNGNCGWPGVYGTKGVLAASNNPGGRYGAANWIDSSGNFWLFGGWAFDASGNYFPINDLWEYQTATTKTNQTITFGTAPTVVVGGTGTVSATASSGLAVTFTSTTTTICTVSGSTVTGVAAGTCTIAANQAGNATYNAAPQMTQNITVGKASQTITFGTAPSLTVGGTGTISATASSGLAVTFTSTTTSICTVSGSTVTGVAAGTCTIAANQAGNSNYNAATQVTQNITVTAAKTNQTITFGTAPTVRVGTSGTVSATASSGLAVTFSSTTTSICTVSGSTVTGVAAGTCTIAANQAGNATYNAAPQVTQNITVGKGTQTITFGTAPALTVGGTGTVSATASSGLAVTFTSTTTSICTVSGSTVTGVAAGTCTIAANQAGNSNYNAATQVTQNITVTAANTNQTITFGTAPTIRVGTSGTLSATASSGLAVTFTSTTTTICTVSGSTVTGVAAGTCTIAANQAGNATYNAAPQVTQNITVGKASQTITFGTAPSLTVGGTGTISATASSGLAVTFTSTTTSICTVSGSTVTGVAAGTCTIAANQAGNSNYNAATQVTQNITVTAAKTNQTITFGTAPTVRVGTSGTMSATASSGLAVTFTSLTTSICTVSGSRVTGVSAGTCTVAANQAGNATYNAAPQVTQNITVGKGSQTITFGTAPALTVGGTGTVSATATSGLAVTFTSTTTNVCTVSGSTVTGVAAGTCTIAANQAGNANYNAARQVTQNITVTSSKTNQTITFGAAPTIVVGGTGTVSATASSGLAVTFSSTTTSICTVSGSTVTGVAAGTCTIAANQTGNATYNAAPQVTQNITVGKGSQTITFGTAPSLTVGGTGTVSATASSGLAVTFTSTTASICTVSGSTVTGVAAGTCTIAANQAGNSNYNAATQVTQNITVTAAKTNQTITFGTAPTVRVGTSGTLSATASSGLAVTFTSLTTSICTVSGSTVTGIAAGACMIAANQAGNSTYNAAPQVTQNLTVGKGSQTITFGTAPSLTVGGTGTVSATASSGLAVTFTSTTTSICTVSGSTVTGVAAGTCTIAANQAGNSNYNAATQVTQNITVTAKAATPVLSPAGGTYSSTQSITITDSTPGATIYYTTDGSTPTTSSTKYTGAISVTTTQTITAIATATGYSQSAVASAVYTIQSTPTVYNVATSFESGFVAQTNPNGVWSYGYSAGFTSPITRYDVTAQNGVNGPNAQYWLSSTVNNGTSPAAEYNNGPAYSDGNVDFLANDFVLVAGVGGQYSDLVFTAPTTGAYTLAATFRGDQNGIGTVVAILHNGASLFNGSVTAVGQLVPYNTTLTLNAGDTLVFSVGPNGGAQNTGLALTITGP